MKFLRLAARVAAWTAWFTLSWIALAHAGPVIALFSAIGSVIGSLGVIGKFLLTVALRVGISLLTKAKKTNQSAGISSEMKFGGDNPLSFIIGNFATPGQLEYANTKGEYDDTKNAYLMYVASIGDIPMDLTGLWVDDKKAVINWDSTNPNGTHTVTNFNKDDKVNLTIKYYDGTQTTADSRLVSLYGSDPDRPWTADMIGRGVPYVITSARFNQKVFSGYPNFLFETSGIALYDPRKDSSVGGSGPHRWDDPSTWSPSNNNALHIYNILRGIYYEGEHIWGGRCEAWQLPLANWMAAMNACDLEITNKDGSKSPQFQNGAEITADLQPADVIEDILKGCNGRIAEAGGIYKLHVGAPGAPVYSFTDETIIVTEGQSLDPFPGLENTFNGAQASYPEPEEKWAAKDAPIYLRTDLEALDDDRQLVTGLQYPYTPYALQIQRLLKAAVDDARRFKVHQLVLPPEAWLLEPGDTVAWTSARNSYTDKKFIVTEIEGDSNFLQYVTLKEVDPSDYSWNPLTDEHAYSVGPMGDVIPTAQAMTGWSAAAYIVQDGTKQMPAIQVGYAGALSGIEFVRVQARIKSTAEVKFDGILPYGDPATNDDPSVAILSGNWCLPDVEYEVRGIFEFYSGQDADWSAWLSVTTPNVWISGGPVDIDQLNDDIQDWQRWVGDSIRDARETADRLDQLVSDQNALNYGDKQELHRAITASYQAAEASWSEDIYAATGPGSAIVLQITQLQTTVNDDLATAVSSLQTEIDTVDDKTTANATAITGLQAEVDGIASSVSIRAEAGASPGGGWARYGVQVNTNGEGDWSTAAFFMDVNGSTSRVVFQADQFIVSNGTEDTSPFIYTGNTLYLQSARLGTLYFDQLSSNNGKLLLRGSGSLADISIFV